jgi:hypothetical protein
MAGQNLEVAQPLVRILLRRRTIAHDCSLVASNRLNILHVGALIFCCGRILAVTRRAIKCFRRPIENGSSEGVGLRDQARMVNEPRGARRINGEGVFSGYRWIDRPPGAPTESQRWTDDRRCQLAGTKIFKIRKKGPNPSTAQYKLKMEGFGP